MSNLTIPTDLLDRLKANPRRLADSSPLTADEREMVALRLEWLAAEVREKPVREASWEMDREVDRDPISWTTATGPWTYTATVQFGWGES